MMKGCTSFWMGSPAQKTTTTNGHQENASWSRLPTDNTSDLNPQLHQHQSLICKRIVTGDRVGLLKCDKKKPDTSAEEDQRMEVWNTDNIGSLNCRTDDSPRKCRSACWGSLGSKFIERIKDRIKNFDDLMRFTIPFHFIRLNILLSKQTGKN